AERQRQVVALLEQLSSRLGEKSVLRPHLRPDPQPEFACAYEPWLSAERGARSAELGARNEGSFSSALRAPRSALPPWLKARPVAVAVVSVVPHGPPIRLEWE